MAHYYPILKGKAAELWALTNLPDDIRPMITPLIEVAPIPWDFAQDQPAKTIDQHLALTAGQLFSAWGTQSVMLDVSLLPADERMQTGRHPLTYILEQARAEGLRVVPVTGLGRDEDHYDAVATGIAVDGLGAALRLENEDFELRRDDLARAVAEIIERVGVPSEECTLFVDFGDIQSSETGPIVLAAENVCAGLLDMGPWRTVVFAATSFPDSMSDIAAFAPTVVARGEYAAWSALVAGGYGFEGRIDFSDYGVAPTLPPEIDPRIMRMSAKLKYTTEPAWTVIRSRDVRRFGYAQFGALCQTLVAREEFRGSDFSRGDEYFAACADGSDGPGNATTWLRAAVCHHLTTVGRQVSSRP